VSLRPRRCVKKAVLWPLEVGCFGRGFVASALSAGAVWSLWRSVWASGRAAQSTATQPGAAPDRPQCCRFCGCVARLKVGRDWRAAGELSVVPMRAA